MELPHLTNPFAKNKALIIDMSFYAAIVVLIITLFSYGILAYKMYFYNKKIYEINKAIAAYSTSEEKTLERQVFVYKRTIDDYATIVGSHKISSNVFSFIESNTLPNVWFSSFNMAQSSNEMRLTGETDTMETLSRQFSILENSKEYIRTVAVLTSQLGATGKISFALSISLNPNIFTYTDKGFLPVTTGPN